MARGYRNGTIVRTGLSLVAMLMLSGAAIAGQATAPGGDALVAEPGFGGDLIAVQATDDVASGGEGIAVGEPDPSGDGTGDGTGDDQSTGDGTDAGTGDVSTGDGTDGDGADLGTGDGTDGSTGDGTDDGTGDGTDGSTGDGTGDGTDDGTVDEVWISDGTGDPVVGDGSIPLDGGSIDFGDGTVGIYYMDGGPSRCGGCEYQDTAGPLIQPPMNFRGNHPAAHQPQIVTGSDRDVARQPVARGAAACLVQHPGLAWMCEWQSGASQ